MCQDVSSAEGSAFLSPTLVQSGSMHAVPSYLVVSVLWNLFKVKPVVFYPLS